MRVAPLLLSGLVLAGLVFACSDDGPSGPTGEPYPLGLSAPESLLVQLQAAYNNREIDPYARLLSRDFVFRFHDDDVPSFGEELGFAEDSLVTRNLFESSGVRDVHLSMTWSAPVDTTWDGEPVKLIVVAELLLLVEHTNNVTLRVVNSIQNYYFRPGKAGLGEDPGRYYLRAWDEAGVPFGAALVEVLTWGSVKSRFN